MKNLDIKGAILFGLTMVLLFGSLTFGKEFGYNNKVIIMCLILSIVLFVLFIKVEKRIAAAIIKS